MLERKKVLQLHLAELCRQVSDFPLTAGWGERGSFLARETQYFQVQNGCLIS